MVPIIILLVVSFLLYFVYTKHKSKKSPKSSSSIIDHELNNMNKTNNNNGANDVQYLLKNLNPSTSTHLDVLLLVATTPENISMTIKTLEKEEEIKQKRREYLNPGSSSTSSNGKGKNAKDGTSGGGASDQFDLDGDWGDEEEDDDDAHVKAHKAKQEEKEKLAKEVAAASGKSDEMMKHIKIEGIDEGVFGQKWVEGALTEIGQWPPKPTTKLDILDELDTNPAVRRNLCMTMGRLNSHVLNSSLEELQAGPKQLLDTLYLQSNMEYRKRTIVLLEATLRIIGSTRSYKLYKTLVECYTMVKIGVDSPSSPTVISTFRKQMEKVFFGPKGVPRIIISTLEIRTPDEDEIATNDTSVVEFALTRTHAENFLKQKIAMATKQNIPPQIAIQTFREGWWILLRWKKLDDGDDGNDPDYFEKHPILANLSSDVKEKFKKEKDENLLVNAWPFVVTNMKQPVGKVKVQFVAPKAPGKYMFYIDIKSQEFLGCDLTFTLEKEVVDKDLVVRKEKKNEEDDKGDDETELKKTK